MKAGFKRYFSEYMTANHPISPGAVIALLFTIFFAACDTPENPVIPVLSGTINITPNENVTVGTTLNAGMELMYYLAHPDEA